MDGADFGERFQAGEDVTLPLAPPLKWMNDRKTLHAAFAPELTAGRSVSYRLTLPIEALMAEGEEPPAPAFHELYAMARAPFVFLPFCDEVLKRLGKLCDVASIDVRLREEDIRMTARLRYVPAYAVGTPQDVKDKIVAVAKKTMMSERAQNLGKETGALVYWQDAADVQAQIAADIETLSHIDSVLGN